MKRIGIITIQKCDNFGADLQAYALGAKLRSMGYDAENIDYLFYKHPGFRKTRQSRPIFKLSLINRIKEWLLPKITVLKRMRHRYGVEERAHAFEQFFHANVPVSKQYQTIDDLYLNPPSYDVYITGSDQVWNPRAGCNIKPYFLDFVPNGKKCISYASSIGVPSVPPAVYDAYRKLLGRYSAIGVREATSERIISGMGLNVPVKTVADPTLLLSNEEWNAVAKQPSGVVPQSYVIEYNLSRNKLVHDFALRSAKMLKVALIDITESAYGPAEFVWLFAHARAAVVCSFHGTLFSIMNRIPFYTVCSESAGRNGGRIALFTRSVGLRGRVVPYSHLNDVELDFNVDFEVSTKILEKMRRDSLMFLRDAIDGHLPAPKLTANQDCYAVWSLDDEVRKESTSGGLFSLLATHVLHKGGIVFGAAFDKDFRHVRHRVARTLEELPPLMKSKYVQSDISSALLEAYEEVRSGHLVLFSGTPCQIVAVKNKCRDFLQNLITVDIVCHGTPRPEVFAAYIDELEDAFHDKVVGYEFRNKKHGWNFGEICITLKSGRQIRRIGEEDPYFSGFARNVFLCESCYSCPYARLARVSDLTIGDCWRVATSHPQYDDGRGTSLLLINTDRGRVLFDEVTKSKSCRYGLYDVELARLRNAPLMDPAVKSSVFQKFKEEFAMHGSFKLASKVYFNRRTRVVGLLRYWVKRLGWFYFKHHQ